MERSIYLCEECNVVLTEPEAKGQDAKWGHVCKAKKFKLEHRCEAYVQKYIKEQE